MEHQDIKREISRLQPLALVVGVVGSVLCAMAWRGGNEHFLHAYLTAYLFWLGLSGGSLGLLFIHHLAGGRWGYMIQRPLEAAAKTMPLMAILFIPIALNIEGLYEWARPEAAQNPFIVAKAAYLNETAFLWRAGIFFVVWTVLALVLSRWSGQQDRTGEEIWTTRMKALSGPGMVIYVLTTSVASIDWAMSLEPEWWSTMYAPLFMIGQGLSTMCVMAIAAHRYGRHKPVVSFVSHQQYHDLGNMMFAFTILWMYMNIAQYIIIWSGNLPEENIFYLHRSHSGWPKVALILVLFHFAIPFLLLLNKAIKRHSRFLAEVAVLIIIMRHVDLYWLITPTFHKAVDYHWLVFVAPFAIGGLWVFVFLTLLKTRPLIPLKDRRFQELSAVHVAGHG